MFFFKRPAPPVVESLSEADKPNPPREFWEWILGETIITLMDNDSARYRRNVEVAAEVASLATEQREQRWPS